MKSTIRQLKNWLDHDGNRRNLLERSKANLEQYAAMEVRRFSNRDAEKAAGYVRVPPLASLKSMSIWYQSEAAFDLVSDGSLYEEKLRIASSYELWLCRLHIAAYRNKYTNRCYLLRNDASLAFFLMVTCGHVAQSQELARLIWSAHEEGMLHDAGSKVGPFGVALIGKWLAAENAPTLNSILEADLVDSSGAIPIYQRLLDEFDRSADERELSSLLSKACDAHILESQPSTNDETHDFEAEYLSIMPYEIFAFGQLVAWTRNLRVHVDHPILTNLHSKLPLPNGEAVLEPLLRSVLDRALRVIPDLQNA